MAANIPSPLKAADLTKFIIRAAQLEKAKPVVAYWCELLCPFEKLYANRKRRILDRKPNPIERASPCRRRDHEIYPGVDGQVGKGTTIA
jgi:hypothetical protein